MHLSCSLALPFALPFALFFALACSDDSRERGTDDRRGSDAGATMAEDGGSPPGSPDDAGASVTDAGNPSEDEDAGAPPATSGACTNPADDAIFASTDVDGAVGDCASGCTGSGSCVTDCVVEDTGLSRACAECFGDVTDCTVSNCALQCLGGGDSPGCMSCRDDSGCTDAFTECSGR